MEFRCVLFRSTSHYRSPITYSEESLEASKRAAERLQLAVATPGGEGAPAAGPAPFKERFLAAMDDDLNSAGALGVLFDPARGSNRARDEGRRTDEAQAALRELAGVLGLTLREPAAPAAAGPLIDLLLQLPN